MNNRKKFKIPLPEVSFIADNIIFSLRQGIFGINDRKVFIDGNPLGMNLHGLFCHLLYHNEDIKYPDGRGGEYFRDFLNEVLSIKSENLYDKLIELENICKKWNLDPLNLVKYKK